MYSRCDECKGQIPPHDVIMTQEQVCYCRRKQECERFKIFHYMCQVELFMYYEKIIEEEYLS